MRSNNAYEVIQKVYYWIQTTVAIIIPTVAMLVCSILIVKQFTFKVRHLNRFVHSKITDGEKLDLALLPEEKNVVAYYTHT